ncbi:tRNA adenosine(34) deaminase TadA [Thiomicrorhabdus sp.]|uniref:tRNA adenosine(34) deaminase TadA n=1 Tax=Thiomicrorhabdus sp. TaxID=2039724 RepID=UPI00356465C5
MSELQQVCPPGLAQEEQDEFWMEQAYKLALRSQSEGEVPVGAVLVQDGRLIGQGWNQPIQMHDPSAHAEILALREAGDRLQNYRLIDTTLYVTLEPCAMCAAAMVHARVARLVYAAEDLKTGAVSSVFHLLNSDKMNHQVEFCGGILKEKCSGLLSQFFKQRRLEHKERKRLSKKNSCV